VVVVTTTTKTKITKNGELKMTPSVTTTKISWKLVTQRVNKAVGKSYSAQYIREVATGYRSNRQLQMVLKDLGVYVAEVA